MADIRNPFKEGRTNWSKLTEERINQPQKQNNNTTQIRIAKSFKVYKGEITRNFDKRVNKLQVHFDDLDYDKNYVDSGKYIMFLMAFAEKYKLYELYTQTNENGEIEIEEEKIKKFMKTKFNEN